VADLQEAIHKRSKFFILLLSICKKDWEFGFKLLTGS
jgi:hypothetical protein